MRAGGEKEQAFYEQANHVLIREQGVIMCHARGKKTLGVFVLTICPSHAALFNLW